MLITIIILYIGTVTIIVIIIKELPLLSLAALVRDLALARKPFTEYYFYIFPVAAQWQAVVWRGAMPSQELCTRKSRIVLSGVHEFRSALISRVRSLLRISLT